MTVFAVAGVCVCRQFYTTRPAIGHQDRWCDYSPAVHSLPRLDWEALRSSEARLMKEAAVYERRPTWP
ncbi:MAG: hypothetical protein ACYSVY_28555, partial [Planctomycetota bacterium]